MFLTTTKLESNDSGFISCFYTKTYYSSRRSIFSKTLSDSMKFVDEQNLSTFKFFFIRQYGNRNG